MNTTHSPDLFQLETMLAYLRDELPQEQTQLIDTLASEDSTYAMTLQLLDEQLREEGEEAIRQRAGSIKAAFEKATLPQHREEPPTKVIPFYRQTGFMAAAAVVLILVTFFMWPSGPLPESQMKDLAKGYISSAYVPQASTRGEADAQISAILQAYQNGEGDAVVQDVIVLLENEDMAIAPATRTELTLALASYNLRQGHPNLGRTRLEALPEGANARQKAQAKWLIAMSHLYQRNADLARPYLEDLAENGPGSIREESQKVLDKLGN